MTNILREHFQMLARYNRLANEKLYDACAQLDDRDRKQIRPAFFQSIHGTINHIMVGDRIWMTRFEGGEIPSTGLDAILYEDFVQLREVRRSENARIEVFTSSIDSEFLSKTIRYKNNAGNIHEYPVTLLLAHFFNHQTHHRGQIHDMIT